MNAGPDPAELDWLLRQLRESRGIDFTGYKRTTLARRFARRMSAVGAETYADYHDILEAEPGEHTALFDSLLINVTSFFRDAVAWQYLQETVVPRILEGKPPGAPVRIWSAGCSTGEEAYTLAMLLVQVMGINDFRDRVKIYATDLDEDALQIARAGSYDERRIRDVPPALREEFFEQSEGRHVFRRDLRRQLIFGRNDLTRDAPISRVDLLTLRNTLMYFNPETQTRILRRMHFALAESGYILLGKAEMLMNHGEWFEPVDLRKRLFVKAQRSTPPAHQRRGADQIGDPGSEPARLRAALLAAGPLVQLAVDMQDNLAVVNSRAENLFGLRPADHGRPFHELELSYRPLELRSLIDRVRQELRPLEIEGVQWQRAGAGSPGIFDVTLTPLFDRGNVLLGVGITFAEMTHFSRLREELEHANEELERAYQELQSLNEELETTNEELQSTNEELETTNEELQSTNEELETMNEELQSTNDELQEINDALRMRTDELDDINGLLSSVMESLGDAVIVMDLTLAVTMWSPGSTDLWGVRADEAVGQRFDALDIGLAVAEVVPMLRTLVDGDNGHRTVLEVAAVNRRGRSVRLRLEALLLRRDTKARGVILAAHSI